MQGLRFITSDIYVITPEKMSISIYAIEKSVEIAVIVTKIMCVKYWR
jgi:hypothetical protein